MRGNGARWCKPVATHHWGLGARSRGVNLIWRPPHHHRRGHHGAVGIQPNTERAQGQPRCSASMPPTRISIRNIKTSVDRPPARQGKERPLTGRIAWHQKHRTAAGPFLPVPVSVSGLPAQRCQPALHVLRELVLVIIGRRAARLGLLPGPLVPRSRLPGPLLHPHCTVGSDDASLAEPRLSKRSQPLHLRCLAARARTQGTHLRG